MVDAAVILAGGSGRRLGGVDKPALTVGGRTLLDRALAAAGDAVAVVVGPPRELPDQVRQIREDPPGAGPAAAVVAGITALAELPGTAVVAALAADQPAITARTVARLADALGSGTDAVLVDPDGRRQYLAAVFRLAALRTAGRGDWTGRRLADLLDPLVTTLVPAAPGEAADIDRPEDLARWTDR